MKVIVREQLLGFNPKDRKVTNFRVSENVVSTNKGPEYHKHKWKNIT